MNLTYIRNTPAEMSPRAVKRIQDRENFHTPPTPRELRIKYLREAIERDEKSTFKVRPETLAEWKRELEELEKQDKPQ